MIYRMLAPFALVATVAGAQIAPVVNPDLAAVSAHLKAVRTMTADFTQ
ncbi:MAG: hypothetical protein JWL91_2050, partial [Sphingomonas bacterium]|nr:hypothetical protein [Sphingomonas bacterium]